MTLEQLNTLCADWLSTFTVVNVCIAYFTKYQARKSSIRHCPMVCLPRVAIARSASDRVMKEINASPVSLPSGKIWIWIFSGVTNKQSGESRQVVGPPQEEQTSLLAGKRPPEDAVASGQVAMWPAAVTAKTLV